MKFNPAPDDLTVSGLFHRRLSENGLVHFGVYRVAYGFRVRAGFAHDFCGVTLDWCGGGDWKNIERLYSIVEGILSQRPENKRCFDDLPGITTVKPFFLDVEFVEKVIPLAGEVQLVTLEPPTFLP